MNVTRFLAHDGIREFLLALQSQGQRVLVPMEKAAARRTIVFGEFDRDQPVTLEKATVPAKAAVLPECECLFTYTRTRDAADPGKAGLELQDGGAAQTTVVFGARPCDARGYAVLDRPYTMGPYADPYYQARREKLLVCTVTCTGGCSTCFCHWTGGGPSSPEGSDILMTGVDGGYVLQAVTEKGASVLEGSRLPDGQDRMPEVLAARKKAFASLAKAPDISAAPEALRSVFSDTGFWEEQTDRCISCGACTYFCPTCYCFTITDEPSAKDGNTGRRLRSWDTCMSSLFTREASGHNPRNSRALRMRNRVSHKYSTYPERWGGVFSCSGCGRCVTHCPVGLDIREIVLAAISHGTRKEDA